MSKGNKRCTFKDIDAALGRGQHVEIFVNDG